jgi:hypothetical protein
MNQHKAYQAALTAVRLVTVIAALFLLYLIVLSSPRIVYATIQNITDLPMAEAKQISLPFEEISAFSHMSVPTGGEKSYLFRFDIIAYPFQGSVWKISVDDCIDEIRINGSTLNLQRSRQELCKYNNSMVLELGDYIRAGHNTVEIKTTDIRGGKYEMDIQPAFMFLGHDLYKRINAPIIIGAWLFLMVMTRLRFDGFTIITCMFSYYIFYRYIQVLGIREKHPDWMAHLSYLLYVKNNWLPPPSHMGWEFWHPPLYYFLAAIIGSIGEYFGYGFAKSAVSLSFFSMLIFIIYGVLIIKYAIKNVLIQRLCICAMLFWPLKVTLVSAINNEVFSYAFWAAALYHLMIWYMHRLKKHLVIALILCAIMALVRTSALVPLGTIGMIGLSALIFKRIRLQDYITKRMILLGLLVIACFAVNFSRTYYYKNNYAPKMGMIIANTHKDPVLHKIQSPATFHKLTHIDFKSLFGTPYTDFWHDKSGRQLFWNTYIKSVLFGFYQWPNAYIAIYIVMFLTFTMFYSVIAPLFIKRLDHMHWFLFICVFMAMAAQIINRIIVATVTCSDGRYTYPLIIPFIAWVGYVIQSLLEQKNEKYLQYIVGLIGILLLSGFVASSLFFDLKYIAFFRFL